MFKREGTCDEEMDCLLVLHTVQNRSCLPSIMDVACMSKCASMDIPRLFQIVTCCNVATVLGNTRRKKPVTNRWAMTEAEEISKYCVTHPQKPSHAISRKESLGPSSKAVTSGLLEHPNWTQKTAHKALLERHRAKRGMWSLWDMQARTRKKQDWHKESCIVRPYPARLALEMQEKQSWCTHTHTMVHHIKKRQH